MYIAINIHDSICFFLFNVNKHGSNINTPTLVYILVLVSLTVLDEVNNDVISDKRLSLLPLSCMKFKHGKATKDVSPIDKTIIKHNLTIVITCLLLGYSIDLYIA